MNHYVTLTGKKQQLISERLMIGIFLLCIILFSVFLSSSIISSGKNRTFDEVNTFKYYTSIEIEPGDTLWTIAKQYISPEYNSIIDYIDEVKLLNNMGEDHIYSGQHLMVPYYTNEFRE